MVTKCLCLKNILNLNSLNLQSLEIISDHRKYPEACYSSSVSYSCGLKVARNDEHPISLDYSNGCGGVITATTSITSSGSSSSRGGRGSYYRSADRARHV